MPETRPAANLLRELRERQGKSLREAAVNLGVAPSHLSRLERGEKGPSADLAERAANYYGMSAELMALAAGRLPRDIIKIIGEHPELLEEIRHRFSSEG